MKNQDINGKLGIDNGKRKYGFILITWLIAAFSLLIFAACPSPMISYDDSMGSPSLPAPPPGMGYFKLSIDDVTGPRTILPLTEQANFQAYTLTFIPESSSGNTEFSVNRTNSNLTNEQLLNAGTWNLVVSAYMDAGPNPTQLAAQGSTGNFTIGSGATTPGSVTLVAFADGDEYGDFKYTIYYSGFDFIYPTITYTPIPSGTAQTIPFILDIQGVSNLPSGYYRITITLEKNNGQKAVRNEILHIYQNMESIFTCTFNDNNFFAELPGTISINSSGGTGVGDLLLASTNGMGVSGTIQYQWYRDGNSIPSATSSTYTIAPEDQGTTITVQARCDGYNGIAVSSGVLIAAATPVASVSIDGGTPENYTTLSAALTAIPENTTATVTLLADITLSAQISLILSDRTITLTSGEANWKISRDSTTTTNGALFNIGGTGSFTIRGGSGSNTLTLEGGTNSDAAVVTVSGGTFELAANAIITGNNRTSGDGGGVAISGTGTIFNMTGGEIKGNSAVNGGGVYKTGSGIFEMTGGTIGGATAADQNTAVNDGGGVYVNNGPFRMNDGAISGNTATRNGGGVFKNGSGTFEMNDGTISGNTASTDGGGVYMNDGTLTLNGGTISGNTASTGDGGGVHIVTGASFQMPAGSSAEIKDNSATNGGGVYKTGTGTFTMASGTIGGTSTADRNQAQQQGGGVYVNNATFTMSGGTISYNTAAAAGGGVNKAGTGNFTMSNGTISDNTASNGGGISVGGGDFTISNDAVIKSNTATGNGGGVNFTSSGTFTMTGGTIESNIANGSGSSVGGGGVYFNSSSSGTFSMSGGIIEKNQATGTGTDDGGGGVYITGSGTFNMSSSAIIGGTAGGSNIAYYGGGVYITGSAKINMTDTSGITYNKATIGTGRGGGLYINSNTGVTSTMSGDSHISYNEASSTGGGVAISNGTLIMDGDASVRYNEAVNTGGGITLSGVDPKLVMYGNTTIHNNKATGGSGRGGGVYIFNATMDMRSNNIRIYGNSAVYQGGGIYVGSTGGSTTIMLRVSGGVITGTASPSAYAANTAPTGSSITSDPNPLAHYGSFVDDNFDPKGQFITAGTSNHVTFTVEDGELKP